MTRHLYEVRDALKNVATFLATLDPTLPAPWVAEFGGAHLYEVTFDVMPWNGSPVKQIEHLRRAIGGEWVANDPNTSSYDARRAELRQMHEGFVVVIVTDRAALWVADPSIETSSMFAQKGE